jgi:ribose-phosphate pyrophosphokinase
MLRRSPLLFALPGNQVVGERLALAIDAEVGELAMRDFPDGETYVRLETDPRGRTVVVLATLARPNEHILPLLFAAGAARQLGAERVGIVAPYLAYMRQDAQFHPGEAITARLFADLLSRSADWLITVDPHLHRIGTLAEVYSIPAVAVHASGAIGQWVAEHVSQPLIIGPDEESRDWALGIAAASHAPSLILTKARHGDEDVSLALPDLSAYGDRTPVIIDDSISTGRTMLAVLEQLQHKAARMPPAVCIGVHALFRPGVHDLLRAAGAARVITTNTVPHSTNCIDILPILGAALRDQVGTPAVESP